MRKKNINKVFLELFKAYSCSRKRFIEVLVDDGFDPAEVEKVVDSYNIDWNEQALRAAELYLDIMPFSYDKLVKQLEYEGFTHDQALYAVDNCDADWVENAIIRAREYAKLRPFSRDGMVKQLEYAGFYPEQAKYAVEYCGVAWDDDGEQKFIEKILGGVA